MRTVEALYLDLTNYPTYGDLAAAKVSYTELGLKTFFDGSSSGTSTSSGSNVITAVFDPSSAASSTSTGSATLGRIHSESASGTSVSSGDTSIGVIFPITGSATSLSSGTNTVRSTARIKARSGYPVPTTYGELAETWSDYRTVAANFYNYIKLASRLEANSSSGSLNATPIEAIWYLSADGTSTSSGSNGIVSIVRLSPSGESNSSGDIDDGLIIATQFDAESASDGVFDVRSIIRISGFASSNASGQQSVKLNISGDFMVALATSYGTIRERHLVSANGWGIPI